MNYLVRIAGPGIDHQVRVSSVEDFAALELIVAKMRRHFEAQTPGFCPECLMTGGHKLRCSKAETPVQKQCDCYLGFCNKGVLQSNQYCFKDRRDAGLAQETKVYGGNASTACEHGVNLQTTNCPTCQPLLGVPHSQSKIKGEQT